MQGGGSATVVPEHVVTPLEGLRAALPADVLLDHRTGPVAHGGFTPLDPGRMTDPVGGGPGAHVTHHAADGTEVRAETRFAGFLIDFGDGAQSRTWVRFATRYAPEEDGELRLGIAGAGTGRLWVDGALVLDEVLADDAHQVAGFFAPPTAAAAVQATAGRALDLRFEFEPGVTVNGAEDSWAVTFGTEPGARDDDALIAEAVAAAAEADVAVVVVGTSAAEESEGFDRASLRLPGRQDDLVSAVAAANRRTVVVVTAGAPVEMPWRDDVAVVLLAWFGGQELGNALADVLLGVVEPGGRLPTTWPARLEDAPVSEVVPSDGVLAYDEGLHIGYRAWQRTRTPPAYPFGAGEGYTSWELGGVSASGPAADGSVEVALVATNTGHRTGKQVVQVYARRPGSSVERPVLWLVGFAVVRAAAGEAVPVRVRVPQRALAHWDGAWVVEPGTFELLVGTSCEARADAVEVVIPPASSGEVG